MGIEYSYTILKIQIFMKLDSIYLHLLYIFFGHVGSLKA